MHVFSFEKLTLLFSSNCYYHLQRLEVSNKGEISLLAQVCRSPSEYSCKCMEPIAKGENSCYLDVAVVVVSISSPFVLHGQQRQVSGAYLILVVTPTPPPPAPRGGGADRLSHAHR